MVPSRLRVYYGPESEVVSKVKAETKPNTVTVPAGEVFELLANAVKSNRTWLKDFADDEITISSDLYEVILAYQHFSRPSAG